MSNDDSQRSRIKRRYAPWAVWVATIAMIATAIQAAIMYFTIQYPFRSAIYTKQIEITIEVLKLASEQMRIIEGCLRRTQLTVCNLNEEEADSIHKVDASLLYITLTGELILPDDLRAELLDINNLFADMRGSISCAALNLLGLKLKKSGAIGRGYFKTSVFALEHTQRNINQAFAFPICEM